MHCIPSRIPGVHLVREPAKRRIDGTLSANGPCHANDRLPFHQVQSAEVGFTAQPRFTQSPVEHCLTCTLGEVYVVLVDVRIGSPTYGQWQGFYLSAKDRRRLQVAAGVAVGWQFCSSQFCSSSAELDVGYSGNPSDADWRWIQWDDSDLAIQWPYCPEAFASQLRPARKLAAIRDHRLPSWQTAPRKVLYRRPRQASPSMAPTRSASIPETPELPKKAAHKVHSKQNARPASCGNSGPILVLGSSGRLGRELTRQLRRLGTVIGASRNPESGRLLPIPMYVDVSRPASIREAIRTVRPTLIVNASGLNDIDRAEAEPRLAQLVNATAPAVIANEARKIGAALIHFCTDMLFEGQEERPYRESDRPKPCNQFARTKLLGSDAVRSSGVQHLILRAGWLYSAQGESYVRTIMELATYRNALTLPVNHYGSPTSASWLARTLTDVIGKADGDYGAWMQQFGGLYHVSMLGYANRVEVADQIVATARDLGLPVTLERIQGLPMCQLPMATTLPANCRLDPSLFSSRFEIELPRWQDELRSQLAVMVADRLPECQVA